MDLYGVRDESHGQGALLYYRAANGQCALATGYTGYGHITQIVSCYYRNGSVACEIYDYSMLRFTMVPSGSPASLVASSCPDRISRICSGSTTLIMPMAI